MTTENRNNPALEEVVTWSGPIGDKDTRCEGRHGQCHHGGVEQRTCNCDNVCMLVERRQRTELCRAQPAV